MAEVDHTNNTNNPNKKDPPIGGGGGGGGGGGDPNNINSSTNNINNNNVNNNNNIDPKHNVKKESFDGDFIVISEFSEKEGPVPLQVIPDKGEGTFNLNSFVLKIMAVDFQNKSNDPQSYLKDSQAVIPEAGEDAFAYVCKIFFLFLNLKFYFFYLLFFLFSYYVIFFSCFILIFFIYFLYLFQLIN